jgi:Ca-activated chloride channel family protein
MTLTDLAGKLRKSRICRCLAILVLVYLPPMRTRAEYSQSAPALPPMGPAIAIKTKLVVLPVRVLDANGAFVTGLSLDNFRVFEDGRLQRISLFQREDTPVSVGLVVDHSRSMGPKLAEVAAAIFSFAQSSNPQDEMFVVDFNDSVSIEQPGGTPFTHEPSELASAISAVSANGQTALYDAVIEGLNHLRLAHGDKKALVIVSDGGDNASKHTYAEVLALARRSQTAIYAIGLIGAPNEAEQDPRILQRLCNDTGGMAFFPEARQTVAAVTARIAGALREQYTLGFVPYETGNRQSFRKLKLQVSAPGRGKLRVQTRPGYSNAEPVGIAGKHGL